MITLTVEKEIALALMVKVVAVEPAGTTAEAGVLRRWLELRSKTAAPPGGAAAVSIIVQVADPSEVKRSGAQFKEERDAATGAIVILHFAEALFPALSCTSTVMVDVPAATGVPPISPVENSTSPAGREPEVTNQM